jgi:glycosyltransferase involved in cell wall biosynthesis
MPKNISKKIINKAFNFEKNVYSAMDKVFTMSEYLRLSIIKDFEIDEKKVYNIGAGINFDKIPHKIQKNYEMQNILFIGIRFYRKGGGILLKAFRILKDYFPEAKLHIIGPHKLKIPKDLAKGVIFHGFLSKNHNIQKKKLEKILSESSLFVLPSIYEPFGIAPLEAMVNQIPCVLTEKWAFPEMVKPGVNGYLVKCNNVEDLSEKMKFLIGNPDLLKKMGKNARNLVVKNYTWDIVVKKLTKIISTEK